MVVAVAARSMDVAVGVQEVVEKVVGAGLGEKRRGSE